MVGCLEILVIEVIDSPGSDKLELSESEVPELELLEEELLLELEVELLEAVGLLLLLVSEVPVEGFGTILRFLFLALSLELLVLMVISVESLSKVAALLAIMVAGLLLTEKLPALMFRGRSMTLGSI